MPKDAKVRRIEQAATVGRGSVVTTAATSSPATPATSTAAPALVGQSLTDGTILIGDSANLAAEQTVSGDATVNRLGVLTLADNSTARTDLGVLSSTTGVPSTVAPAGGRGSSRIARIDHGGGKRRTRPYFWDQNAESTSTSSWWAFDGQTRLSENYLGAGHLA